MMMIIIIILIIISHHHIYTRIHTLACAWACVSVCIRFCLNLLLKHHEKTRNCYNIKQEKEKFSTLMYVSNLYITKAGLFCSIHTGISVDFMPSWTIPFCCTHTHARTHALTNSRTRMITNFHLLKYFLSVPFHSSPTRIHCLGFFRFSFILCQFLVH